MTEQTSLFTAIANAMLAWSDAPDHARFQQANLIIAALEQAGWKIAQIQEQECSEEAGCDDRPAPRQIKAGDLVRLQIGASTYHVLAVLFGHVVLNNEGAAWVVAMDQVELVER